jgi:FYVE, RhoGEF and PH domain containing 5/6
MHGRNLKKQTQVRKINKIGKNWKVHLTENGKQYYSFKSKSQWLIPKPYCNYIQKLRKQKEITIKDADTLFYNITKLHELHIEFQTKLIETNTGFELGKLIESFYHLLSKIDEYYVKFIKQYEEAMVVLSTLNKLDEFNLTYQIAIDKFYKSLQSNTEGKKKKQTGIDTSLDSLFISPIQRLPRYELLIKQILKNLKKESDEYPKFQYILDGISKNTILVNQIKKLEDTKKFLNKLNILWNKDIQIEVKLMLILR